MRPSGVETVDPAKQVLNMQNHADRHPIQSIDRGRGSSTAAIYIY